MQKMENIKKKLIQKETGEFFEIISKVGEEDKIIPLTIDETKDVAEEILSVEKYEEIFGEIENLI